MKIKVVFIFLLIQNCICCHFSQAENTEELSIQQIDSLINLYYGKRDIYACIKYTELGRKLVKKNNSQRKEYIEYTANLGFFYTKLGKYELAESLLLTAYNSTAYPENSEEYVSIVQYLAQLYMEIENFDRATSMYMQAMQIAENILGKKSMKFAVLSNDLGRLYTLMGSYVKAEKKLLEALDIYSNTIGQGHQEYITTLLNLALLQKKMGLFEKAEHSYLKSIDHCKKGIGKENRIYSIALNNLANLYKLMGKYIEIEAIYLESLNIIKKNVGSNHPEYIIILNNLGNLYFEMGKYEEAKSKCQKAIKLMNGLSSSYAKEYSVCLYSLASIHEMQGNFLTADSVYIEQLKISKQLFGKNHPEYATSLNNYANFNVKLSHFKKAKAYFKETLEIRSSVLGTDHLDYIKTMVDMALLAKLEGEITTAWELVNQVISIYANFTDKTVWYNELNKINIPSIAHFETLNKVLGVAFDLLSADPKETNKSKQIIISKYVINLIKNIKEDHIIDNDKLRMLTVSHNWLQKYLKVLDLQQDQEEIFNVSEIHKSALLKEATRKAYAYQLGDLPDSLIYEEKSMQDQYNELEGSILSTPNSQKKDSLQSIMNELQLKMNAFKKHVALNYPKFANLKYQNKEATIEAIQQILTNKSAILEYIVGDSLIYGIYIDKKNVQVVLLPTHTDELNQQIDLFRHALTSFDYIIEYPKKAYADYTKFAYWCYQNLVAPMLDNNMEINHLIIIPDGKLGHLPFEAFLARKPPIEPVAYSQLHYLLSDYKISYDYSATLWKENIIDKRSNHNGSMLAMAGNYSNLRDSASIANRLPIFRRLRGTLHELPHARSEIKELSNSFEGYFGFDQDATERHFKDKASQFGIIHLALHGLLDSKHAILSSLAFTEDGDSVENNFLRAYEISKLNLNADLVVLSGCETGFGKFERGNGLASLARSFMYAGVPSMLVTLWKIEDQITSSIMKDFYINLNNRMDKAEALRQAKLSYMIRGQNNLTHPAFWSAYIQIGNHDHISIKKKQNYWQYVILTSCMMLLFFIIYSFRRKFNLNNK